MAHLVSTDRDRLLRYGIVEGLPARQLQFKPLKDPRTGCRRAAWHWDLVGDFLRACPVVPVGECDEKMKRAMRGGNAFEL
ncbi:MAG: hypothetical protein NVSMB22_00080 [Chloroflexota bacterium]